MLQSEQLETSRILARKRIELYLHTYGARRGGARARYNEFNHKHNKPQPTYYYTYTYTANFIILNHSEQCE